MSLISRRQQQAAVIVAAMLLLGSVRSSADTIDLLRSVRLPAQQEASVRLRDVATLEGEYAQSLADIVVIERFTGDRALTLTPASIRRALNQHEVNWGRIALNGRECIVRPSPPMDAAHQESAGRFSGARPEEDEPKTDWVGFADGLIGDSTVRGRIAHFLSTRVYRVSPASLRLTFAWRDEDLLQTKVGDRQTEILLSGAAAGSGRLGLRVNFFAGDRITDSARLTVDVRIRRHVVLAARYIGRGEPLGRDDVFVEERLIVPHPDEPLVDAQAVVGKEARGRLVKGQILRRGDIESPVVIKRNAEVTVLAKVGQFVVRMRARALESGQIGQVIRLCRIDDKTELLGRVERSGLVSIVVEMMSQGGMR